jgi:uroporphyrinogen decarboxylase
MSATPEGPRQGVRRRPDFENLRRALLREGPPGPVPFIELFADPGSVQALTGETLTWGSVLGGDDRSAQDAILRFCCETGYDYVYSWTGLGFRRSNYVAGADTGGFENFPGGVRMWQDESSGPIQNWADFEAYPWPAPENISYRALEHLNAVVPDGMKICAILGGIYENASCLMGFESFCYALADRPDLVAAIFERVADLTAAAATHAVGIDNVEMLFVGDDLGFATGTLISPQVLREHVFPQHRRLVEIGHRAGKLVLLHSCGNLSEVMEDVIQAGFDAKHSFEDKIMPVEEVFRRWGNRIAILGGVDMDLLGRGSEEDVRRRTREILEVCAGKGTGYCLGTGNSVANYLPLRNYLAMLDEGRRFNREHFAS